MGVTVSHCILKKKNPKYEIFVVNVHLLSDLATSIIPDQTGQEETKKKNAKTQKHPP